MIKVPGTPNAPETVERLIGEGVNVNITLLFDIAVYEAVARAYVAGLERALEAGRDLSAIASVASFFVSRVDTQVDGRLADDTPLRGKAGVANARAAYARFAEVFSGGMWDGLAAAGARVQRPLWASTGTKNAAYSDVLYVDNLVAPHTVNTLPEPTLNAFADHGDASHAITPRGRGRGGGRRSPPSARRAWTSRRSRTSCSSTASTRSRRTSWRCCAASTRR